MMIVTICGVIVMSGIVGLLIGTCLMFFCAVFRCGKLEDWLFSQSHSSDLSFIERVMCLCGIFILTGAIIFVMSSSCM